MQGLEYLSGSISFNELKKFHINKLSMIKHFIYHFESALSVLDSLGGEQPDTGVEPVHEQGPHGGPVGHTLLLEVGPGSAHQALPILGDLLQASL